MLTALLLFSDNAVLSIQVIDPFFTKVRIAPHLFASIALGNSNISDSKLVYAGQLVELSIGIMTV